MSWSASYSPHQPSNAEALLALARLIEQREDPTGQHVVRARDYSVAIARSYAGENAGSPIDENFLLRLAAITPMHDIGKSGLPDAILLKPGSLTPDEFEVVKSHVTHGAKALAPLAENPDSPDAGFYQDAVRLIRSHHENWDGSGYPDGLRGEAIPIMARIFAVADAFDALTSWRCYRAASTVDRAVHIIEKASGQNFDPKVVHAFVRARESLETIRRASSMSADAPGSFHQGAAS